MNKIDKHRNNLPLKISQIIFKQKFALNCELYTKLIRNRYFLSENLTVYIRNALPSSCKTAITVEITYAFFLTVDSHLFRVF